MSSTKLTRSTKIRGGVAWYIGQKDSWVGPYSTDEVIRRLKDGLLAWVDYIWTPTGGQGWHRICDLALFQTLIPKPPSDDLLSEIREAAKNIGKHKVGTTTIARPPSSSATKTAGNTAGTSTQKPTVQTSTSTDTVSRRKSAWFLQFEGSEFGPLTQNEVQVILKSGKLKGQLFGWHEGMPNWLPVEEIEELHAVSERVGVARAARKDERRKAQRVPLVATVRYTLPSGSYMGVCRDINTTGMLILSNRMPSQFAAIVRLEVSPLGSSGVDPFVTEAEVIRALPDHTGFSVRFKNLSEKTRSAIEKYMSKQGF